MASFDFATLRSGRTGDYLTTAGPEPGEGLRTNGRLPHNRWSGAGRRTQDEREITSQPLVRSRAKDSGRTGDYLTTAGPEPGEGLRTNGRLPHNRWSGAGRRTQDEREITSQPLVRSRAKDSGRTGDYLTTAGPEPGEGLNERELPHNRWSRAGRRTQDEREITSQPLVQSRAKDSGRTGDYLTTAGPEPGEGLRTNGRLPHNRWSGAGRRTQDEREITSQPLVQSRAKDSGRTGDYLTTAGPEPGEGLRTNGRLPHNRWSGAGRRTQDEREITSQPLVQSRAKDSGRTGDYLTTAGPEPGEGLRTNGRLPHNRWSGAGRRTQDERGNGPYRSP